MVLGVVIWLYWRFIFLPYWKRDSKYRNFTSLLLRSSQIVSVKCSTHKLQVLHFLHHLCVIWRITFTQIWSQIEPWIEVDTYSTLLEYLSFLPSNSRQTCNYMMLCAVRATKGPSTSVMTEAEEEASHDETSLNEESEPEQKVIINHPHPNTPQPVYTNMYMPYIEGPKIDWIVNDALYHRFLKWKLKCKNILECELATLPECQKCKKVITWSGNFRMDQYISWEGYPKTKWILDTIWERFEDFCKPQSNEVWAQFISWPVFIKEIRASTNGTMLYRHNSILQNILLKLWKYYIKIFFGSSYMMKISCLELLQKEVLIWTSSLPVESGSYQKSLRAQRPLCIILNK